MLQNSLSNAAAQTHAASVRLQRSVKLLLMSSQEFGANIADSAQENPFLEMEDGVPLPKSLAAIASDSEVGPQSTATPTADGDEDASAVDGEAGPSLNSEQEPGTHDDDQPVESHRDDGIAPSGGNVDGDASDRSAYHVGLASHLQAQLRLMRLSDRELALACFITELLDEDGYLRCDPEEELQGFDPGMAEHIDESELEVAVRRVQSLDPEGVGARSVKECLLLQMAKIECPIEQSIARAIAADHLDLLARREFATIAALLRSPRELVERSCRRLRMLEPRPGWRFAGTTTQFIVPDIVVVRKKGVWQVELNPAAVPRVRLNEKILSLYHSSKGSGNRSLATQLQEARQTMRSIEKRFCTIVDVARVIVDRQQKFFEFGEIALKPLMLREIAEAIGVHESTVSRVTNQKFLTSPSGVFEMKHFVTHGVTMRSGKVFSGKAIRRLLGEMIAAEGPGEHLTDSMLATRLREQGFSLTRRTVTKYRHALRIDVAAQRQGLPPASLMA